MLCGRIGSGKTTFAKRLEREIKAVRFTHDEWVARLFGTSPPEKDFAEHYASVDALVWKTAISVVRAGSDVIVDYGFWSRESRRLARDRVSEVGATPKFYLISCPQELAKDRTLKRSENPPSDSLWIDEPAFEKLNALFEPMTQDEKFVDVDGRNIESFFVNKSRVHRSERPRFPTRTR